MGSRSRWLTRSEGVSGARRQPPHRGPGAHVPVCSQVPALAVGRTSVPSQAPAIAFDHVSLAFDDVEVLRDVSFRVPEGDMTILLGPSGAGKSLILKLTLGLLRPDAGSIAVHGQPIEVLGEQELIGVRDRIGMLFQETALFDSLTVGENVGFKLQDQRLMDAQGIRTRVHEVLHFVGLDTYTDRLPAELSGGQRRRVAIARAMAAAPTLLLLDDPTSGLDPLTAKTVLAEIIKLRDLRQVAGLVVTHELQDAFYIATHEAVVEAGAVTIRKRPEARAGRAHFLVLGEGDLRFDGSARALMESRDPWIVTCLSGWIPQLTLDAPSVAGHAAGQAPRASMT